VPPYALLGTACLALIASILALRALIWVLSPRRLAPAVGPVESLLVDGAGILDAPGLGKADVPATGCVPMGGMDDLAVLGRINARVTVSAGVDAARDLSEVVSRLIGEVGAMDIFPSTALDEGLGRPAAMEAVGRASRFV